MTTQARSFLNTRRSKLAGAHRSTGDLRRHTAAPVTFATTPQLDPVQP